MASSRIFVRRFLFVLALFVIAVWGQFLGRGETSSFPLSVYVFDVGQGDAILVRTRGGVDLLIDGGPDERVLDHLGRVLPSWDRTIEAVILTHPHADHLTGLVSVLSRFQVIGVWSSGATHTTDVYLKWLQLIRDKKIPFHIAKQGAVLDLGEGIRFTILFPFTSFEGASLENLNNTSVVGRLTFGEFSMLLSGDAEIPVFEQLSARGVDFSSKILKVAHQGSSDATNKDLVARIDPEVAVISVGKDNQFRHPHPSVITTLEVAGIKIYRTDEDGTVVFQTDGATYSVSTR